MGRTVFFGGTFNPPHNAHKLMLSAAAGLDSVERVLVVPASTPPHKEVRGFYASGRERLEMCRLLCENINKAQVSDVEIKRGGVSYTNDTLKLLREVYDDLFLLIGGDMLVSFDKWYHYEEILKTAGIIAVGRPGSADEALRESAAKLRRTGGRVEILEAEMPDVSSTEIRECFEQNDDERARKMLPGNIFDYIKSRGLYR